MRTRTKLFVVLTLALLIAGPAVAQEFWRHLSPAVGTTAADDQDVAMIIAYRGTENVTMATTTVEVDANSINLLVSGAAAEGIVCPTGGTDGEINITNAACDTLGEICDHINASASGYKCVIIDGLRTDYAYATDKKILTTGAASGTTDAGVTIYWDTDLNLAGSTAILSPVQRTFNYYFDQRGRIKPDPFAGITTFVTYAASTASTCTAAGNQVLYGVHQTFNPTTGAGAETVHTWFTKTGSTTTTILEHSFAFPGKFGLAGEKLLFRRNCATAYVNAGIHAAGYQLTR
jgi:WD40 repeat protein